MVIHAERGRAKRKESPHREWALTTVAVAEVVIAGKGAAHNF